ncbi:Piso0_002909 [Millerozyma farinosa CBS 7064]|uniref:Piso0_002909 protein n=1 Tax=Pichia sorbitophila (strain ATCC MYA-4447 / BCRC 22081 / CBS 7064 / NBRC 10061 / NRRL Y-12695) TaxID=559304 RepID=G8YGN1_PICSO|nr:Piso0_002909 [Millerozyma farinosa CBS 7064]CCE80583.1 Piso0_002909 [Millerozyma farinosa CBS 7064]
MSPIESAPSRSIATSVAKWVSLLLHVDQTLRVRIHTRLLASYTLWSRPCSHTPIGYYVRGFSPDHKSLRAYGCSYVCTRSVPSVLRRMQATSSIVKDSWSVYERRIRNLF